MGAQSTVPATASGGNYIFAGDHVASAAFDLRTAERDFGFLLPYLQPGMRVVDCGCGGGAIAAGLASIVTPGLVVGFDQSETAIDQARERAALKHLSNLQFHVGDVYAPPVEKESFDIVLFTGVLAHLSQPERALDQAFNLLKPGGLLAVREPQKRADWFSGRGSESLAELNNLFMQYWRLGGGDPSLGERLGDLLTAAGFEDVQLTPTYSAALSSPQVSGSFSLSRLQDTPFVERLVASGLVTTQRLEQLRQSLTEWQADAHAMAAISECVALAWKPNLNSISHAGASHVTEATTR